MLPRVDLIRCDDGEYLLLQSPDYITSHLKRFGHWGNAEVLMCKLLTTGINAPCVLDIGANLGSFSVPVARHLQNAGGKIVCFEPQRIVFQQLCANLFLNRIDNAYTYNIALGHIDTEIMIPELDFNTSHNIGGFSLQYFSEQQKDNGLINHLKKDAPLFAIRQVCLDNIAMPGDITFIKVDVEGYELEVFQGAVETLKKHHYPPIFFEVWDHDWYQEKAGQTKNLLTGLGYILEAVSRDAVLAQHPSWRQYLQISRTENNLTFTLHNRG